VFRKKLSWQIIYPFIILIILLLIVNGYYHIKLQEEYYYKFNNEELKSKTLLIQRSLSSRIVNTYLKNDILLLKLEVDELSAVVGNDITIIAPQGNVVYDSGTKNSELDNQLDRPEVISAKNGNYGFDLREDLVSKKNNMYASVPMYADSNELILILRTSMSVDRIDQAVNNMLAELFIIGALALLITGVTGSYVSRKIKRHISDVKSTIREYENGMLKGKVYLPGINEMQELGETVNLMAASLDKKIKTISNHSDIQQAVLESMIEGVIAVDNNEKILLINATAEKMLRIETTDNKGKTLQEIIRIADLQKFFKSIQEHKQFSEDEITLNDDKDKILQLRGSLLFSSAKKQIGVLVVINDITELKHLDNLKRDFVANVSHELKTPITTIKGFIETLREGALNDKVNSNRFLGIVQRHVERLNIIVEDLLSLSRLEQKTTVKDIRMVHGEIKPLLTDVIDDFYIRAREKNISVILNCDDGITADINPPLLEEAVGNLLDNAIKYSNQNTEITVSAASAGECLSVIVQDQGPGIESFHIPRLFERFYRVDKARSRDQGGTGLGLSIVKHIAQVHGGVAEVESKIGKGSIFSIKIPIAKNNEFKYQG
jgi:two-component system phosphate regulon sensor histidine kinase PhoR